MRGLELYTCKTSIISRSVKKTKLNKNEKFKTICTVYDIEEIQQQI